jgi:hypothetical protein
MKKIYTSLFLIQCFWISLSMSQEIISTPRHFSYADSIMLANLPMLSLPDSYKKADALLLPSFLNNSDLPYFRPIFQQNGWSCGQAASIGYVFTYEINRLRDLPADTSINQYPTHFAFNFFNGGIYEAGVGYHYTWDLLKWMGTPNVQTYGGMSNGHAYWMSGYEKYYHAMQNRLSDIHAIYSGDEEGILTVKHWLHDRLDGSLHGGLVNFYTDYANCKNLPDGTPEEGKCVIIQFGPYSGHAMTLVGWNDSIRWDYNNDGQFTNHIDINGDGLVDVKDWEIGGFILANSYDTSWADEGFSYVMYKVFAEEKLNGGIWNKTVHAIDVKDIYTPAVTFKVNIHHNYRSLLKISMGISSDTNDLRPEFILDLPVFNHQGGQHYLTGIDSLEINKHLEFGLDATPLLTHVEPNVPAKFFVLIRENDPGHLGNGMLESVSLIDYLAGGVEVSGSPSNIAIPNNGLITWSSVHQVGFDKVSILTDELPPVINGQSYSAQLTAEGGAPPYSWELPGSYTQNEYNQVYPEIQGVQLNISNAQAGQAIQPIDFSFPFYGSTYDTISVCVDGFLMPGMMAYPYPYHVDNMVMFKYFTMISGFYDPRIAITNPAEGVWYEGNESYAAFRWIVNLTIGNSSYPIDFTAMLYPSGKIEFFYQTISNAVLMTGISGISAGNGSNYLRSNSINTFPVNNSRAVIYEPINAPAQVSINENGELSIPEVMDQVIYNIPVKVIDFNEIGSEKTFMLSNGIIYDYTVLSGNDNRIECGESPSLSFTVKNISAQPIHNTVLNISTDDDYITILDGSQSIGNINPGESIAINDAVSCSLSNAVPDNYDFTIHVDFNSSNGNWSGIVKLKAFAPVLEAGNQFVPDGDNERLDPGETTDVLLSFINTGNAKATDVECTIVTSDNFLTINGSNTLFFDEIVRGETVVDTLNFTLDESTPQGHIIIFEYTLILQEDLIFQGTFQMMVGRIPVLIVDLQPTNLSISLVSSVLDDLTVKYHAYDHVPADIGQYQNVFIFLGQKNIHYVLTEAQGQLLADFLVSGGNLYFEGGVTWKPNPPTAVHQMFNVASNNVSWSVVSPVIGVGSTFTEEMVFEEYTGFPVYDHYFSAIMPAFTILHGNNEEHGFAVAYDQGSYKTISTMVNFYGLGDGNSPSTKKELMKGILDFFDVDYGTNSLPEILTYKQGAVLFCHPNPFKEKVTFSFDLESDDFVTLTLFSINLADKIEVLSNVALKPGKHTFPIQTQILSPGIYVGELRTQSQSHCIKLIRVQ